MEFLFNDDVNKILFLRLTLMLMNAIDMLKGVLKDT